MEAALNEVQLRYCLEDPLVLLLIRYEMLSLSFNTLKSKFVFPFPFILNFDPLRLSLNLNFK